MGNDYGGVKRNDSVLSSNKDPTQVSETYMKSMNDMHEV